MAWRGFYLFILLASGTIAAVPSTMVQMSRVVPPASLAQSADQQPGLIVEEVVADSAAAKAGLKVGDHVLSYDGKPLPSPAALRAAEENTFSKEEVALRVRRGEETLTLMAAPGKLGIEVRPELSPVALTLYEEGRATQKAQKTDDVITRWTAAAKPVKEAGDTTAAAWLYGRVGEIHEGQRQWKEASEAHAAAWELLQQNSDAAVQSRTLVALGRCSRRLNDLLAAQRWYEQAQQVDARAGNEMWVADDFHNLGIIAYYRGDLAAAQNYYSRALSIREGLAPDSLDVAMSLNNLGLVVYRRGDLAAAQNYFSRALTRFEELEPHSLSVAGSLNNLGLVAWSRGDLVAAQEYYNRALTIHERLAPDSLSVAPSLNNLGLVAWSRGDLVAAQEYYNRALTIYERLAPDSLSVANSLNNLGNVAYDHGDLAAAQDYHGRALAIRERLAPDSLDVAMSLNNLGNVAYERGDLQTAQDYHGRALAIRERLAPDSLDVAFGLSTLGDIARDRGDLVAAQGHYSRALAIRERLAPDSLDVASSLDDLGSIALKRRRFSDARSFFSRAVDIVEAQRWQIRSTDARALLLAQHTKPYTGLLHASLALNDLPAAFAAAERAHARSLLDLLAEAKIDDQQGIDPALKQRERDAHARIAWIQRQLIQGHSQESPDKNTIAQLEEQLKRVERERNQLETEIRKNHPRYAELQYPTPLGLKAIQDSLDEQTTLLEYALDEERSFLFVITRTDSFMAELPPASSISDRVNQLRETLITKPQRSTVPTYIDQARSLHRVLIEPAGKSLRRNRHLIIVPDGILHYLPFEVLLSSGDERSLTAVGPHRWPYLVRDYAISYIQSASVLASLHRSRQARPEQRKDFLAYADPAYGAPALAETSPVRSALRSAFGEAKPWTLKRLPYSREEANRIAALYPRDNVRIFLQQDAREENVKVNGQPDQYRFIHFATHGLLNENQPQYSGLVLSLPRLEDPRPKTQDSRPQTSDLGPLSSDQHRKTNTENNPQSAIRNPQLEDGLLQVYEIFNLKLNADLVVLSACETGLGKEVKGEGLIGLTRAFLYAGTPSVVVSLWKVSDRSTAELMVALYQHLEGQTVNKAEALRQAQLKLIEGGRYAHPYYWAPFVLVGAAK